MEVKQNNGHAKTYKFLSNLLLVVLSHCVDLVHVAPALKRLWVVVVRISDHFFRLRHEVREATCDVV